LRRARRGAKIGRMSELAAAARPPRRFGVGRIVLLVLGVLAILIGLGLVAGGTGLIWVDQTKRDADGFLTTRSEPLETASYAILSDSVDLHTEGPDVFVTRHVFGKVRFHATGTGGKDVFIGIAPASAVNAYLRGVGHATVDNVEVDPFRVSYDETAGGAPKSSPGDADFWTASAEGPGRQTITWTVRGGSWSVVLMNADASQGVAARVAVGAEADSLLAFAIVILIAGILALLAGGLLLWLAFRRRGAEAPAPALAEVVAAPDVPVGVRGEYDPGTSRALWLVKWLLLLPHYVVLVFLWIAFFVLTVITFFAILITGRYPRGIFDFNLGVLRWTWRVMFYGYWALGTDRYPPFSLGPEPGYPATLDIAYPEEGLSRGLVLVKWWLLVLPQYVLVGIFVGGWGWGWHGHGWAWWGWSGGLVELLAVFAAVALLFTRRYPPGIFDFVLGLDRWVFRVTAYASLMTDRYPPFRLDQGPTEPGAPAAAPGVGVEAPPSTRPST
jgi:uncharacterized protein DUF4389